MFYRWMCIDFDGDINAWIGEMSERKKNLIYPNISQQQQQATIGHSELHNLICNEIGREKATIWGENGFRDSSVPGWEKWVPVTDGTSRTDVDIIHYHWPIDCLISKKNSHFFSNALLIQDRTESYGSYKYAIRIH